jgi:hypothetical protein
MNFKNLESDDILITPFQVHKTFTVSNHDSGSGIYSIPITKGSTTNLYNFSADSTSKTVFTASYYEVSTYHVMNAMYYRDIKQMRQKIDWIAGTPKDSDGIIEYTENRVLYDTQRYPSKQILRRPYSRQLHDSGTVISVPQELFGEYISPQSVEFRDNDKSITLVDDGRGNLYDVAFKHFFTDRTPDSNHSGSVVGNVFYSDGFLVITDTGSYSDVGRGNFNIQFDSTQTIYEREYVCNVDETDFQHTNNKSLKVGYSGSVGFHPTNFNTDKTNVGTINDTFPYGLTGFATGSYGLEKYNIGTELIGEATHSDFSPYITSIGLYNNNNELIAMGKTSKPIKNDKEMSLSFVVRFDTN